MSLSPRRTDCPLRTRSNMVSQTQVAEAFIPPLHVPSTLLPIFRYRAQLLYLIETYPVVILVGETGSGKTTQLPQFLDQSGWCADGEQIAVTQVSAPVLHRREFMFSSSSSSSFLNIMY